VNEVSARLVAAGVATLCATILLTRQPLLLVPLCYGFWARVLTGPRLSPLGQVVTRFVTPALGREHLVPGPPKRFAQGMGAAMSTAAVVAWAFGHLGLAWVFVAMILAAATLEAAFAFCLGCTVFAGLMRIGVVPAAVCAECADLGARYAALSEKLPRLNVVGGCCGTDHRHLTAIAANWPGS
jgi:hypothetical protein